MKISTPRPKARTLDIIRQIAYTYQPNAADSLHLSTQCKQGLWPELRLWH